MTCDASASTVMGAVVVFLQHQGQAMKPIAKGAPIPTPPPPVVEGFPIGACDMEKANALGKQLTESFLVTMAAELARACHVEHLPADQAKANLDRSLSTRMAEMGKGINVEKHAGWFQARHTAAFTAAARVVLGDDVDVHYGDDGSPVKIRKKGA
jgi:hypothetical protein